MALELPQNSVNVLGQPVITARMNNVAENHGDVAVVVVSDQAVSCQKWLRWHELYSIIIHVSRPP